MLVEVWSDVVCPWCYIGKRRLETALAGFEQGDGVEVRWRSFELDRHAPAEHHGRYDERLAAKYRTSVDEAQAMIARMVGAAAAEGIDMRFDLARPGSTFDAHRVLHLAARHGVQAELKERLLAATFTEGRPIGNRGTLRELATEVGLDGRTVAELLAGDELASEVRADEAEAARLGITAVPFFVVDRRYGVAGAQGPDVLLEVLRRAWAERTPAPSAFPST